MFLSFLKCLLLFLPWIPSECRLQEHRQFQYNSQIDGRGTYNFAYDTSHQPSDAHSLHMEYRDANGIVRGRYGYTDPRGNLRIVEYEAGPDGYKARGDVGPDLFPHMEAPGLTPQKPDPAPTHLRMAEWNSHMEAPGLTPQKPDPAPTPLRMAGWDPEKNPINERVVTENDYYSSYAPAERKPSRGYVRYSEPKKVYSRRPSYSVVSQSVDPDVEIFQQRITTNQKKSKPYTQSEPLTIYNIDVDPDDIRVAGPPATVESRSPIASSVPQRSVDIITTSPEITYYERSPRRRISQINHYHDSYPRQRARYYSYGQRIQKPRQVSYSPRPHYHGQQYHFD